MSALNELYQEVILDHSKHPRNFCKLAQANHKAEGYNPLCGDRMTLYLNLDGDIIKDISFEGSGCAISTACCSLLTEHLKGKKINEVEPLFCKFHSLVTGLTCSTSQADLGKMKIFEGVREFPMRVKCATLAWHTLKAALENREQTTTE